ncbi:MAG: cysteine peptidase family C39 domain-containing protein, partial [Planctomycetota bacterium]
MSDSNYSDPFEDYDPDYEDSDEGFDHSQFDDPPSKEADQEQLERSPDNVIVEEKTDHSETNAVENVNQTPTQISDEEKFAETIDQSDTEVPDKATTPTSLTCLALIGRHHGLDISPDRVMHEYSLENEEPTLRRLLRICKESGLKAKHAKLSWKQLRNLDQAFPVMVR